MGARSSSFRARALLGVVASALLVLIAPSIALAANTASFSYATPKAGSYSEVGTPKISVRVYDRYGAKRSGITMYLDGKQVSYSLSYIVSGSWNPRKPDYRRSRLTYQVAAPLGVGSHKVTVKVRDLRGRRSSYSWSFNVDLPTPPATFSLMAPADGSSSEATTPRISIKVVDRWDVKGAGSKTMTLDGVSVPVTVAYTTAGNYRSFTLSYRVLSALAPGSHSVTVAVRDAAARTTSQTWAFTVLAPPPVYAEMPVDGASCGDCHTGYPAAHPTDDCALCHGEGAPPRPADSIYPDAPMSSYTPGDASAHTLGCMLESPCHGGGGPFPHTVGNDCARCHNPSYPSNPQAHPVDAEQIKNLHAADPTFCTSDFCHSNSLTAEHYRHTGTNGLPLACGTCHESTDPVVAAAILSGDTACTVCHELNDTHPNTTTAHAAVGSCVRSGCHSPSVTAVHKNNCLACHATGVTPSTNCGGCHATGAYHSGMTAAHTLSTGGCVAYACHGVDLGMDAALTHKNTCTACHNATDTPSLNCVGCHSGAVITLHPAATLPHTPPATFCTTSDCHGSDVAATHLDSTRGCTACHAEGVTPSTTCATCHSGDQGSIHENAAAAHNISAVSCIDTGCHSETDVSVLHDAVGGPGCVACHAAGTTPTLTCATCHPGELPVIHAGAGGNHTSVGNSCIVSGCHPSDVTAVHTECSSCHGGANPLSAQCATCHTAGVVTIHASADTSHTAPVGFCNTACHSTNVATIHESKTSCAACHNPEGHAPSVVCADCHTGTANENHSWAVAGHISSNPGCQLPGCHVTDVVDVHDGTDGPGCAACHATGVTPSTLCGDCHVGDVSTLHTEADASHAVPEGLTCDSAPQCHSSNVSVIHASTTSDCAACHADGVTASTTCATCHAGTDEYIHRFGDASHGASSPGCVSANCHLTDVSSIHNAGPSCLACHAPDTTAGTTCSVFGCHPGDQSDRHAERAGTAHDIATGTCVVDGCHGTTAEGVNAATLHASGPGCIACHADGVTATLVCADCHVGSFDIVHTRGSAYHTAPRSSCDGNLNGACHVLDVIELHGVEGGPACAACHAPGVTPTARCADCHTGAYWGGVHVVGTLHNPFDGSCVTDACHNKDAATIHTSSPPTNGPSCAPCHRVGTLTIECRTCHTVDMTPRHSAQDVVHTAPGGFCVNASCHGGSDAGANVASLHSGSTLSCAACHANGLTPTTDCLTCHSDDPLATHPTIGTSHDAPSGTCVRTACHGTTTEGANVVTLHGVAGGPGCAACHGPGITPTVTCSAAGCHAAVPATEHAKYVGSGTGQPHNASNSLGCTPTGCHTNPDISLIHGGVGCICHQPTSTLTTDCSTLGCHVVPTPAILIHQNVAAHAIVSAPASTCISGTCHNSTVDTIHQVKGGPKCTACHAVGGGPATTAVCADCHINADPPGEMPSPDSTPTPHPTATTADTTHTVAADGCTAATCHSTNLAAIHSTPTANHPAPAKCMACHDGTKPLSKLCADCHFSGFTSEHPAPAAAHAAPVGGCVKDGCHGTTAGGVNAATLHALAPLACNTCHGAGVTPTLDCQSAAPCHGSGAFPPGHPAPPVVHTSTDACTTLCHVANVATQHTTPTAKHPVPPGCTACHDTGVTASLACADCHTPGSYHADAAVSHTAANSCISASCHNADVSLIHVRPAGTSNCYACHAAGTTASTNCAQCHSVASGHPHANCDYCHSGGSHYGYGTTPISGRACSTCHGEPFQSLAWGSTWNHTGCSEHCHTESSCDCH